MQIQALLFKELSTHNPMDGSIFGVLHSLTHTFVHTERQKASHTLLGIQGRMLSLINIHMEWHIHAHTVTQTQKESPPLQHGCYILRSKRFKLYLVHNNFKTSRLSPAAMQHSVG